MIAYDDKTYCEFKACCNWKHCSLALTIATQQKADEWWATFKLKGLTPIAVYTEIPSCYNKYE